MTTRTTRTTAPAPWTRWQDWVNLLLGVWLIVAPWVLRSTGTANSNAWWVGVLIALVSIWALGMPRMAAAEWCNIALGIGLFIAPWVLHYVFGGTSWNAWIVGAVVVILAAWALSSTRQASTV